MKILKILLCMFPVWISMSGNLTEFNKTYSVHDNTITMQDTLFDQLQGRLKTLYDKNYKSKKDGKRKKLYSISFSKEYNGYYLTADQWKKLPEKQQLWIQSEFVRIVSDYALNKEKDKNCKIPAIGAMTKWARESNWGTSIFCLKMRSTGAVKYKADLCPNCATDTHTDDAVKELFFRFETITQGMDVFYKLVRRSHYTRHFPKNWKEQTMTSEQFLHALIQGGYSTNNDSAKVLSRQAEALLNQATEKQAHIQSYEKSKDKKVRAKAKKLQVQTDTLYARASRLQAQASRTKPVQYKNIVESNDNTWLARTRAAIGRIEKEQEGFTAKFGKDINPSDIPGLPQVETKKKPPTPPAPKKPADTKQPATKQKPQAQKKPK